MMFLVSSTAARSTALLAASPVGLTAGPQADSLMIFGFLSAVAALTCWRLAVAAPQARLLLAICLALQATFVSLAGAWPTGLVAIAACIFAVRWWFKTPTPQLVRRRLVLQKPNRKALNEPNKPCQPYEAESRLSRLFGPTAD